MSEVLRFHSREQTAVERTWAQFTPSARLHRVDQDLWFRWRSTALDTVSFIEFHLAASVVSSVEPEDQLIVSTIRPARGTMRGGGKGLAVGQPWISDGREMISRWEERADVQTVVFDPG